MMASGNAILRHPTLTILQQIEELKSWHKHQQSKLEEIEPNGKGGQRRGTIENIRGEKSSNQNKVQTNVTTYPVNFDELPVKATDPNLFNIIENNVIPDDVQSKNVENNTDSNEKPKFRFLKRGEGIARFKMGPPKKPKYKSIHSNSLKLSSNSLKTNNEQNRTNKENLHCKFADNQKSETIPTLKPPDLKLEIKKSWKSIFESGKADEVLEKAIDNNMLELFQPNSTIDSSTASLIEKFMLVGEFVKEKEEQRIFNLMEQHVLDSSFSSTSTYVENMMKNAIISTPVKHTAPQPNHCSIKTSSNAETPDTKDEEYAIELNAITIKDKTVSHLKQNENNLDHSVHVRFAEEVDYKSFTDHSQSFNISAPKEISNPVYEPDMGDEWKEDNSDCCSQCGGSGSSDEDDPSVGNPPNSSVNDPLLNMKQNPSCGSRNDHDLNSPACSPTERLQEVAASKDSTSPTTIAEPCNCPAVLIEKKKELEREIQIFQVENHKIRQMQESLERERKQFQRDKKKFLKELEEERKKNALQMDEERKKLAKEKSVFERYSKSLTKNPTREERKEIHLLQDQVSEMKHELSKKESRWGSAQARVRNQVKLLEEDNKKLKEEIEVLRKQAKQLEIMTQKRKSKPFNNTKLIHEINNHISNVVIEDEVLLKDSEEVGYFNPNASAKTVAIDPVEPVRLTSVRLLRENPPKSTVLDGLSDNISRNIIDPPEESGLMTNHNRLIIGQCSSQDSTRLEFSKSTQKIDAESLNAKTNHPQNTCKEVMTEDGNIELIYPDGRKDIKYKNGNIKKIDLYSGSEKMIYFNGDVREVTKDGTIKYFYFESRTWQTTLPDGLEIFDFPNQQVEKRHKNGMVESIYPNGTKQITYPNGSAEIHYADDGRVLKIEPEHKRQVLLLPNGQKEIRTDEYVRREYPDGTVRTVHPDGTIETVYSNGRVRLKDKHGNLVMDSGSPSNGRS